jgi:two-component system phosphate regulon sensor histidine kinase PhoR
VEPDRAHRDSQFTRRAGLFWKLFLAFAVLSTATIAVLALVFSKAYQAQLQHELDARLHAVAVSAGELLRGQWPTAPNDETQTLVRRTGQRLGVRLTLIDMDGRVLADSSRPDRPAVEKMENHRDRLEFIDARRTGLGAGSHLSPTVQERLRYVAVRIDSPDGAPLGVVRVSLPAQEISAQIAGLTRWIMAIGTAVAVTATLIAYWAISSATAPLRHLAGVADAILAGQHDQRLPVNHQAAGEIGALARALGELRSRLTHGERQLRNTSQTQATVLEGMTECVIAVDRHERLLFANAAAGRALGFNSGSVDGLTLLEAVRSHELRAAMLQALHTRQAHNCEIDWRAGRRRTFDVLAAPLPGEPPPGAVMVLRDITELRRLEQLRQQFIANVSHELKTPLSSIKAYTETLLGGARHDPEHCERFLGRIDEQAGRLHEIIQDMLSLARIEAGQAVLELTNVPLARIARRCIADFESKASAAGIVLDNQVTDSELKVWADEEGVRQILSNLIDNAVKYTPAGGRVTVRCKKDGSVAVIEVVDTGVGIAPEHHSRVFERFYRVDRARSRELGGTGLGLSIVKHLCLSMGGQAAVTSELHNGSTFEVRLPLAASPGAVG